MDFDFGSRLPRGETFTDRNSLAGQQLSGQLDIGRTINHTFDMDLSKLELNPEQRNNNISNKHVSVRIVDECDMTKDFISISNSMRQD